MTHKL